MLNRDYFEIGLPFFGGGVVFLLAFYLLGLMVPANVARADLAAAVVHERAVFCHQAAVAHMTAAGDKTDLKADGVEARDARDALAAEFAVASGDATRDHLVRTACSAMLNA